MISISERRQLEILIEDLCKARATNYYQTVRGTFGDFSKTQNLLQEKSNKMVEFLDEITGEK